MQFSIRTACFLFFLFVSTTPLLAQKKGWQDVVYLHNGSIIRGELLADTLAGKVKIETIGRNVFVYDRSEVKQVIREFTKPPFKYPFRRGYLNLTEMGLSVGNSASRRSNRNVDPTLQTFNGYQFAPALALGLTAGIDFYGSYTLMPVGLGIRGDLLKTKVRPFYGFDTGYAFDWLNNPRAEGNYNGGFFWSPSLGIKFNSAKTHAFVINLAYRHQPASLTRHWGNSTITQQYLYRRVLFRVGFSF